MDTNDEKRESTHLTALVRGAMRLGEFLSRGFDVDKELLGRMILVKSIGMIAGPRGGGKSWLALLFAYSVAGGKSLDPWGDIPARSVRRRQD